MIKEDSTDDEEEENFDEEMKKCESFRSMNDNDARILGTAKVKNKMTPRELV